LRNKKIAVVVALAVGALALGGCGKGSVDISTSGAEKVPGAGALYRLCDQSTLVYFSSIKGSSDEYEAFFYGGCGWDEKSQTFLPAIGPNVEPRTSPTDPTNDEMNQQDERQGK
jgi:hypothetical protein